MCLFDLVVGEAILVALAVVVVVVLLLAMLLFKLYSKW